MEQCLLGLPLDAALEKLAAAGVEPPTVEYTRAPRGEALQGAFRVVRQRPGYLVVARFADQAEGEP